VPAYAATSPDRLVSPTPPGPVNQALANILQREQAWLGVQSNTLAHANTIAANAQNWINTLDGYGARRR
jgi:hypothetical protein